MALFSTRTVGTKAGNLGIAAVTFDPKRIAYGVLVPSGTLIDAAAKANIKAWLIAGVNNIDRSLRFQVFGPFVTAEPQGKESTKQSTPSGYDRIISEGGVAWLLTMWKGDKDNHTALRRYNGIVEDNYDILFVDIENNLIDVETVDANGAWAQKGYSLTQMFTDTFKMNDGTTGSETKTFISLADPSEFNDHMGFIELDFNFGASIKSLTDIKLKYVGTGAPTSTIILAPMAGAENLVSRPGFATILGNQSRWITTRDDTGQSVTISSASSNPALGVTLVHTLTSIPSGTPMSTRLVDNQALATAGMKGFESDTFKWQAP
jgi:hypothetical protein